MRKTLLMLFVLSILLFQGCGDKQVPASNENPKKITAEMAMERLSESEDEEIIIVDVRTYEEYIGGHIPGAILLPIDSIEKEAEGILEDKSTTYFVYCRSGNRSNTASQLLADMGYEQIYDLGGIIDWPYEIVKGE